MGDNNKSIIPVDVASSIANLAQSNPEQVYDKLKKAEDWIKEIKGIARNSIISKMNGGKRLDIDAGDYKITATAAKPKIKIKVCQQVLAKIGVDKALVMYPVTEFEPLPNAHDTLAKMLEAKLMTQQEYDSMFDEPIVTVKTKNINSVDAE